jgi:hypothetical protein
LEPEEIAKAFEVSVADVGAVLQFREGQAARCGRRNILNG